MKLSIAKSVGKKIILVAICVVLLMIFTSTGYGGPGNKWKLLARPEQELLTPRIKDKLDFTLIMIAPNLNSLSLIICINDNSINKNQVLQDLTMPIVESKTNNAKKIR